MHNLLVHKSDPFAQNIPKQVALRLVAGTHTKADRAKYYKTQHFEELKDKVINLYRSCVICGEDRPEKLTAHHRPRGKAYKNMFQEHLTEHVCCICQNCHSKRCHPRKGRR